MENMNMETKNGLSALDDEALELVAGGRTLFREGDLNRNSWFVSLISMLMARDAGRPAQPNEAPRQITVDGKAYRVLRVQEGGTYKYVLEEL